MSRIIIVTGAARGIGKAIALKCLAEGLSVIGCDKDSDALETLERTAGKGFTTAPLDVTDPLAIEAFFKALDGGEAPYALVNNAGIFLGHKLLDHSLETINQTLDVNLKGTILCSQAFGALLINSQKHGAIVNIASVAGQAGSADAIYGASKAGIVGFTKTSAMAFAPFIRVNAVAPGIVETDMQAHVSPERRQVFKNLELIKETIQPEAVADAVWFLLSDASKHFTGAVLDINNGFYLR